jgi:Hydrazine synthase alpha subunit middle domain
MKFLIRLLPVAATIAMLISPCGFASSAAMVPDEDIIITAAPAYHPLAALHGEERFLEGAQLMLVHQGTAVPLVKDFAASADANVSFDGKSVLFAGKRSAGDPWQIWELTIADGSVRRIIDSSTNAIRPFYLPAGQLVYALRTSAGYQLVVAGNAAPSMLAPIGADAGSATHPISYLPASAIPVDVLLDGRILFEANYPLGTGSTPELYLVYSDGSGVESYRCDHGRARWGGAQLSSGDVVFTHGSSLARFTSPLSHEVPVVAPRAEYAGPIAETKQGDWLVSARTAPSAHYALKLMKPSSTQFRATSLQTVLALSGENLVEPVLIAARTRTNHHPSALHRWNYANLLALDSRLSREGDLHTLPASVRLEMRDAQGHAVVNGTAPVAADGSFFVRVPADRPIRFALLNAKGAVVRQEHGWFWIRSGEQRICTGCHTGPERASENRVPAVLMQTTIPVDLTGTKAVAPSQTTEPGEN